MPVADLGQVAQHRAPEPGGQPPVQRQVERVPAAREILVEFPGGRVEADRGAEDARADLVGQRLQHGVVTLAGEGHPDQALLGGGQQQRADRAVDGAVGDVEQAVLLGRGGQPGVQPAQPGRVVGEGLRQHPGCVVRDHRDAPFDEVRAAAGCPLAGCPALARPGLAWPAAAG